MGQLARATVRALRASLAYIGRIALVGAGGAVVMSVLIYFGVWVANVATGQGTAPPMVRTDCTAVTPTPAAGQPCFNTVPPGIMFWTGTAWAHYGMVDTTGTPVVLDAVDEIASVALAGQQAAALQIPGSQTADLTLTPVISVDNGATFIAKDHLDQALAVFRDGLGNELATLTFPLVTPANPVALSIETNLAATHIGVKVTVRNSGSVSATVRAVMRQATQAIAARGAAGPTQPIITDLGSGVKVIEVGVPEILRNQGWTRTATDTLSALNDDVIISGSGASQVCFEVPSGATMTTTHEAQVGSGAYFSTPVVFYQGSTTSYPSRGCFLRSGYSNYKVRVANAVSGSVTGVMLATTGSPREVTLGAQATPQLIGFTSPIPTADAGAAVSICLADSGSTRLSTASTNSTSCKGSAGNFYGAFVVNPTATVAYLRLYDSASAPTCTSATGFKYPIPVPASTNGSGFVAMQAGLAEAFTNGIGFCFTGGSAGTDNTNGPAGVLIKLFFK